MQKGIFFKVARHYQDEVSFAAVDCWHLACNCSRPMPPSFSSKNGYRFKLPTVIVHYGYQLMFHYRAEWSVVALTRFINNLLKPVVRLNSRDALKILNMRSNSVLLGLFRNVSAVEYCRFANAAVKWLEMDPDQVVRFAVWFGAAANDTVRGLGSSRPLIVLIRGRDIEVFHFRQNWTSNHLVAWLLGEVKRMSRCLMGFSTPLLLIDHVRKGAVLAIFSSDWEHPYVNFYMQMSAIIGHHQHVFPHTFSKKCDKFDRYDREDWSSLKKRFYEFQFKNEFDNILIEYDKGFCKATLTINNCCGSLNMINTNKDLARFYMTKFQPTVLFQSGDQRSTVHLLEFHRYNECLKGTQRLNTLDIHTLFAKLLTKFIKSVSQEPKTCHNRTMPVQIIDASKYRDILHNFGFDNIEKIQSEPQKTTVLIIEPNQEGVYKMENPFSYEELLRFIKDYYHGDLYISRRTEANGISSSFKDSDSKYCLEDLNQKAFLHRIEHFWQNATTVLLLYRPSCAFSSMMSHSLMQVFAILQSTRQANHINIVRLNTQTNDLPWEFITHVTPALFVFPRGRASETRLFPTNLGIDVRRIFAFILAQLRPIEQVRVALGTCSPTSSSQHLIKCLTFVRTLSTQHISDHLKLWQLFEHDRQDILRLLKQLKNITLKIQKKASTVKKINR